MKNWYKLSKEKLIKEAEYWGSSGSGVLYVCPEDNTGLLLLRSDAVEEPGVWGIPGGAVGMEDYFNPEDIDISDHPEDYEARLSAEKEVEEEIGHLPKAGTEIGKTVFRDEGFMYTTYIIGLTKEQKERISQNIVLNWESDSYGWFSLDRLPEDVHHGVAYAVNQWRESEERVR